MDFKYHLKLYFKYHLKETENLLVSQSTRLDVPPALKTWRTPGGLTLVFNRSWKKIVIPSALVNFLLLCRQTMTKATYIRRGYWDLAFQESMNTMAGSMAAGGQVWYWSSS